MGQRLVEPPLLRTQDSEVHPGGRSRVQLRPCRVKVRSLPVAPLRLLRRALSQRVPEGDQNCSQSRVLRIALKDLRGCAQGNGSVVAQAALPVALANPPQGFPHPYRIVRFQLYGPLPERDGAAVLGEPGEHAAHEVLEERAAAEDASLVELARSSLANLARFLCPALPEP